MNNFSFHIVAILFLVFLASAINYIVFMHKLTKNAETFEHKIDDLSKELTAAEEVHSSAENVSFNHDTGSADVLTGLPDRKHLTDYLHYIASSRSQNAVKYALLIVNMDFFRSVNNNLGYENGDKILIECASRIRSLFSEDCFVARMDGDEFGIVTKIQEDADMDQAADKILKAMKKPILIFNQEVYFTVSIGISVFSEQSCCCDLIRNASIAVSAAKRTNRSSYRVYSPDITKYSRQKFILHSELYQAIKRNEFVLHYQPKIDSKTYRIVGVEALIRWNHPTRGLLYPIDFIPLAEETGVIKYIDEWVLSTACTQLQQWIQAGISDIRLAVNLSAWQFRNQHLVETIEEVLHKTGIAPHYLELEITESAAIDNMDYTESTLTRLMDIGISISIDDFGTGYSSLSYLKNFPVSFLKIDKSFIADMISDKNTYTIVKAMIEVGHALDLKVIAEGVESQEQLDILSKLDCDEIQGFHISKPMNVDDISKQMRM